MTIGLLDPALFTLRDPSAIVADLDSILGACHKFNIRLIPYPEYWTELWRNLGRRLEGSLPGPSKASVQQLRKYGLKHQSEAVRPANGDLGSFWKDGFETLFSNIEGESWVRAMAAATLRATNTGERVVLFCRLVEGRNLTIHRVGQSTLNEITRWVLHLQMKTGARCQVSCIHHARNLCHNLLWTTRFDWRLPTTSDGAGYPFCPPDRWWCVDTTGFTTIKSKNCWVDSRGNGWARPNVNGGAGYHWDVYVQDTNLAQTIGLDQINIVAFGNPAKENQGEPGWIHHLPDDKEGKVDLKKRGWTC